MKKLFLLLTVLLASSSLMAGVTRTIDVATAGSLPDLISESEKYEIEELTLTGELNGTDFRLLRDMAGCNYLGDETNGLLKVLDISNAKIVAGGDKYVDTDHLPDMSGGFSYSIEKDNELSDCLFAGCKLTDVNLPTNITNIGTFVFLNCYSLASVTIPDGVVTIGQFSFKGCQSITSLSFPATLSSLSPDALGGCTSIQNFFVDSHNANYSSDGGILYNKDQTSLLRYPSGRNDENYSIPNGVITIGNSAFSDCSYLVNIAIPYGVSIIDNYAFSDCTNLNTVTIPNSVTTIGYSAFSGCKKLSTVTIPNSVVTIQDGAFGHCYGLTSIEIPSSVSFIGNAVFRMALNLSQINVHPDNENYCSVSGVLFDKEMKSVICFPEGKDVTEYVIPEGITNIEYSAFFACQQLTSISIPKSVITIGAAAFESCQHFQTIFTDIQDPFELDDFIFTQDAFANATLCVPSGCKSKYQDTKGWSNFVHVVERIEDTELKQTIQVSTAGTLSNLISENDKYQIEELTLTGELNGTDFRLLRDMAGYSYNGSKTNGRLKILDLSGARIVAGGEMYLDATKLLSGKNAYSLGTFQYSIDTPDVFPERIFQGCNLESITLPETTTQVGNSALGACLELESVIIPGSATKIDNSAFWNCNSLESIEVASENTFHASVGGVLFNKGMTSLIIYPRCINATTYTVPATVTNIDQYAFDGCANLTSIILPEGLKTIGIYAFKGCAALPSVSLPSSVNSLDVTVFERCMNLGSIIVDDANENYSSLDGVLFSKDRKTLICYPNGKEVEGYSIPNGVNTIARSSFQLCDNLVRVTIPNTVTTIKGWAFGNCTSLTTVIIPQSVNSIDNYAFYGCKDLANITSYIADPFDIEKEVFWGPQSSNPAQNVDIYGQATLYVPLGCKVKYEGANGWKNFTNIEELDIDPTKQTIHVATAGTLPDLISESEKYTIEELTLTGELNGTDFKFIRDMAGCNYLGEETAGKLKVLDFSGASIVAGGEKYVDTSHIGSWGGNFSSSVEQDDILPSHLFMGCKLTSVKISDKVTAISDWSFALLDNMTSITIPNTVKSIGSRAFQGCSSLASITIPASVSSIANDAFMRCYAISSISVESENTIYDSRNNCNAIIETSTKTLILGCGNTIIPDNVVCIGDNAFLHRDGFTSLVLPRTLTKIGVYAFGYCTSLKSVTIPDGVKCIDAYAFEGCSEIETLNIPSEITTIGFAAFRSCSSITSLHLPKSLTSIGDYAFQRCNSLTSIDVDPDNEYFKSDSGILFDKEGTSILCYPASKEGNSYSIPNNVTIIGKCAFGSCSNLTSVNLHNNITTIGDYAFEFCSSLKSITIPGSVTSIGGMAFYNCDGLTSVVSEIANPFEINDNVFTNYSVTVLIVPAGTKSLYQETNGWKKFENIVEVGLTPMDDQDEINYGEDGNVDGNTNLEGTIIDNVYYNITQENGGFDTEDKCIVVNKAMSDEEIESVFGKDLQSDEVKQTFTGLVIEVPAGKGNVKINAQTTGGMTLKVKIGSADPVIMEIDGKLKVTVPYNVIEPTYVYIYAGEATASVRRRTGDESEKNLRIYGLSIDAEEFVKGNVNADESIDIADAVSIVNYIVGKPTSTSAFIKAAADANGDGVIDIADAVHVVNLIVGKINAFARQRDVTLPEAE